MGVVERVKGTSRSDRECLEAGSMAGDRTGASGRIRLGDEGGDLVERHAKRPEPGDRLRAWQLCPCVAAVSASGVDCRWAKDAERVVVPQRAFGEAGEPREPADRQERLGLLVRCRVLVRHAADRALSGSSKVNA